jgi:hypothetical protein
VETPLNTQTRTTMTPRACLGRYVLSQSAVGIVPLWIVCNFSLFRLRNGLPARCRSVVEGSSADRFSTLTVLLNIATWASPETRRTLDVAQRCLSTCNNRRTSLEMPRGLAQTDFSQSLSETDHDANGNPALRFETTVLSAPRGRPFVVPRSAAENSYPTACMDVDIEIHCFSYLAIIS